MRRRLVGDTFLKDLKDIAGFVPEAKDKNEQTYTQKPCPRRLERSVKLVYVPFARCPITERRTKTAFSAGVNPQTSSRGPWMKADSQL